MSTERRDHASTTTERLALFAGGENSPFILSSVDVLDLDTGQWSIEFLSEPRRCLSAASTRHRAYFAGGESAALGLQPTDTVDVYDELTGSWTAEQMPLPRSDMGAASIDGKVFFAGGLIATGQGTTSQVQIFDEATSSWEVVRLPAAALIPFAVADDDHLCVVNKIGNNDPSLRTLDIYRSATGTWEHVLMPRVPSAGTLLNGTLYLAHCQNAGVGTRELDVYDIESRSWSRLSRPTARCLPIVEAVDPYIVLAHGYDPFASPAELASADIYDTRTGVWSTLPMASAFRLRSSTVHRERGQLFVSGGNVHPLFSDDVERLSFDRDLGTRFCTSQFIGSTGAIARIGAYGIPTALDDVFSLTCEFLPAASFGMFLVGDSETGPFSPPSSLARLCLGGNFGRFANAIQQAGAPGTVVIDVNLASLPLSPPRAVAPGETWRFQYWFRDPLGTSFSSDAIAVTFQ